MVIKLIIFCVCFLSLHSHRERNRALPSARGKNWWFTSKKLIVVSQYAAYSRSVADDWMYTFVMPEEKNSWCNYVVSYSQTQTKCRGNHSLLCSLSLMILNCVRFAKNVFSFLQYAALQDSCKALILSNDCVWQNSSLSEFQLPKNLLSKSCLFLRAKQPSSLLFH